MISIKCPKCKARFEVDSKLVDSNNKFMQCPICSEHFPNPFNNENGLE